MHPNLRLYNDQILAITHDMLMRSVTARVANELRMALRSYFDLNGYFPRARSYTGTDCNPALTQGQIPLNISGGCSGYANWLSLPAWFGANQWDKFVHYAVSTSCSTGAGPPCATGDITVTGKINNARGVIL